MAEKGGNYELSAGFMLIIGIIFFIMTPIVVFFEGLAIISLIVFLIGLYFFVFGCLTAYIGHCDKELGNIFSYFSLILFLIIISFFLALSGHFTGYILLIGGFAHLAIIIFATYRYYTKKREPSPKP